MYQQDHFAIKRTVFAGTASQQSGPRYDEDMRLTIDTDRREITIYFTVNNTYLEEDAANLPATLNDVASSSSSSSDSEDMHDFKFQIPFAQLPHKIIRNQNYRCYELIISLPTAIVPRFFKKMNPSTTHEVGGTHWTINQVWYRRTAICSNAYGKYQRNQSLSLDEPEPFIDMGSWTTYRVCINKEVFDDKIQQVLEPYNIAFQNNSNIQILSLRHPDRIQSPATFWHTLDSNDCTHSMLQSLENNKGLSWYVRYQLEVCVSKNILNPTNISVEFITKLSSLSEDKALRLLEHVADKGARIYDPMMVFSMRPPQTSSTRKIHRNHILQRSITVKPSSIEIMTPSADETNRIIRKFKEWGDRFIRINFRDEKGEGKIFSDDSDVNLALFNRVKRTLNHGLLIGGRHYEWLASGNSQFREHGVYMFAKIPGVKSAKDIRLEMGQFDDMHIVAKFNARMGQCFSTTREFDGTPVVAQIPDVETTTRGTKVCFTDGVGKISHALTEFINIQMKFSQRPSAFQFRLGGTKGVLVYWPDVSGQQILTRPSQEKFQTDRSRLEIIRPATFVRSELNRQLIMLLSCLGIPDDVFIRKLKSMLKDIDDAMYNEEDAKELLQKRVDVNSMTLTMHDMIKSGFMAHDEPFFRTLLLLWRAWTHKKLKEKAGIQIDLGAFVMGVTDETKTLRGHNSANQSQPCSDQKMLSSLPEIFLQVPDPKDLNESYIVTGICLLARNPSLHPGDIRVVRAVNVPALRHLKNVVVFPQTGDIDIPSMCSGGDLDGDDFFVTWDAALIPKDKSEWNHPAMEHTPATPTYKQRVADEDLRVFFVNHIKQDMLGMIAHAWLAQADWQGEGPKAEACKQLARLHSTAVDFPKNGVPASGKEFKKLRPREYPHYLQGNRPDHKVRKSTSIVGQLYDMVQRIEYQPIINSPFDRRVLDAYEPNEELDQQASILKNEYDAGLRRIMAQFEVETEAEIFTGFVMRHSKGLKEYELQSKIGELVNGVKEKFREACIDAAGGRDSANLYPFVASMYRVTAQHVRSELQDLRNTFGYHAESTPEMAPQERPLVSFPWIFHQELGQIASGRIAQPRADVGSIIPKKNSSRKDPEFLDSSYCSGVDAEDQRGSHDFHKGEGVKHAGFASREPLPSTGFFTSSQPTTDPSRNLQFQSLIDAPSLDDNSDGWKPLSPSVINDPAPKQRNAHSAVKSTPLADELRIRESKVTYNSSLGTTKMYPSADIDGFPRYVEHTPKAFPSNHIQSNAAVSDENVTLRHHPVSFQERLSPHGEQKAFNDRTDSSLSTRHDLESKADHNVEAPIPEHGRSARPLAKQAIRHFEDDVEEEEEEEGEDGEHGIPHSSLANPIAHLRLMVGDLGDDD